MLATGVSSRKRSLGSQIASLFAVLLACALTAAVALAVSPAVARAAEASCSQVNIVARAQTDGSLHVTEQRIFSVADGSAKLKWGFGGSSAGSEAEISSMRVVSVDADGNVVGEWQTLPKAPFQTAWRDAGGPDHSAWSFDRTSDAAYVFLEGAGERVVLEMDYVVADGVVAYDDIGEIMWRYVPESWAIDSENVTLTVELPVPSATQVVPGGNVHAWGHGPAGGEVSVQTDGTVAYCADLVSAGQYAEARVAFPVSWLSNLDRKALLANQGTTRLGTVFSEEEGWADQENNRRVVDDALVVGSIAACALVLLAAVILYLSFGREFRPRFTDEYLRAAPAPELHPALVGRLWRWNRESSDDFAVSVMRLASMGALRLGGGSYPDATGAPMRDFYLVRAGDETAALSDPLDRATMEVLFDEFAAGAPSLWFASIRKFGEEQPASYVAAMSRWQHRLSEETAARDFFDGRSLKLRTAAFVAAGVLAVAAVAAQVRTGNLFITISLVVTAAALVVLGNCMPRRTKAGNEVAARCKAMRNYVRDLEELDEEPPVGEDDRAAVLLCAYLFGVEGAALERAAARFFPDGEGSFVAGALDAWFAREGSSADGAPSGPAAYEALSATMAQTMSRARASISEANAKMSGAGRFSCRRRCRRARD